MTTVAGVFDSTARARQAETALRTVGLTRITALLPGSPEADHVPVSAGEQPGMGAALGGLVGGAVGAAGGLGLGAAAATLLIPGVGPVGIPADEVFVYKDALRRGKSILFVEAGDEEEAERASAALTAAGAESIDAAREQHWIGLRGAELEHYSTLGGSFEKDEAEYRKGFQDSIRQSEGGGVLEKEISSTYAYRCGYNRGLARRQGQ